MAKVIFDLSTKLVMKLFILQTFRSFTPSSVELEWYDVVWWYDVPKTHKKTLKIRPIVSGRHGIYDRIGWFLQVILCPLLKHVSAHVDSTSKLIQRYEDCPKAVLKGQIPVSFDVVSLYTNIGVEEAINTALSYAEEYKLNTHGLTLADLSELLHLMLENNVFECEGLGFFKQIRGLAMGNRLSGTLAILVMDRFERNYIFKSLTPLPAIYLRYVDDTGTLAKNTDHARGMLTYLNSKHDTIKFELEIPNEDGYLPILDTMIKIEPDGSISRKLYVKAASKGITLNYRSHHPTANKIAIIHSELARARNNSSTGNHREAAAMITNKLISNGYPEHLLQREREQRASRRHRHRKRRPVDKPQSLVLRG